MNFAQILPFLVATLVHSAVEASPHRCWISSVVADGQGIRIVFGQTPDLRIRVGAEVPASNGLNELAPPDVSPVTDYEPGATVLLRARQVIEVTFKGSVMSRCLISPILGPQFVGISLGRWFQPEHSSEPMFMGTVIKASN